MALLRQGLLHTGEMNMPKFMLTGTAGRCIYRSSYRQLAEDEQNRPEERRKRESYDKMIHLRLGSPASTQDFDEDYSTLEFEL